MVGLRSESCDCAAFFFPKQMRNINSKNERPRLHPNADSESCDYIVAAVDKCHICLSYRKKIRDQAGPGALGGAAKKACPRYLKRA